MKLTNDVRQGDVLICPVSEIPADGTQEIGDKDRTVLAHGEVTGHAHAFYGADFGRTSVITKDKVRYLRVVEAPAMLLHEEHTEHKLSPGDYILPVQGEYTPKEIKRMAD